MKLEIRTGKQSLEIRNNDSGGKTLFGYALKYNTLSQNLGGFVETIAPGAVDKSLADGVRVLARYNHDDNYLLGTTDGGTLALESDSTGLLYTVDLPDTQAGHDVAVLAGRGDLHQSSFAFYTMPGGDEWGLTPSEFPLRTLTAIQLHDVAPVNSPAYLDTSTGVRSLAEYTGLDVAAVSLATTEQVRSIILGKIANGPQRETHEPEAIDTVAKYAMRLEFSRLQMTI